MATRENDLQAAPPDDGGHLGSFTKPGDTLQTKDADEPKSPALHRDQERPKSGNESFPWFIWLLIAFTLVVAVVIGLLM